MTSYNYTLAALPTLSPGEKLPISEEEFLDFAEDTLTNEDFQILLKGRFGSEAATGFAFLDQILAWDTDLRLELAKARLLKHKFDFHQALPDGEGADNLVEESKAALAMDSPLEAEYYLNQLRWNYVDEMGSIHYTDLEAVIVYYFKLQLAQRQETFQKEKGQEAFKKTYDSVIGSFTKITL